MKNRIGRILGAALLAYIASLLLSTLLWMNPGIAEFYQSYHGHPGVKPMDFVGGVGNWVGLNYAFGILYSALTMTIFVFLNKRVQGRGWIKGLVFGVLLWALKAAPEAFNQWMLTPYPEPLILVQLANSFGGLVFTYFIFGLLLDKFKVLPKEASHENAR